MPDLRLPSQPQNVTARWPVPNYTACWQRHEGVKNLPKVITQPRQDRDSGSSASPTPIRWWSTAFLEWSPTIWRGRLTGPYISKARFGAFLYRSYDMTYFCVLHFWATVCKTVRPMLSDRCLSVLFVTLVYCGQTAGWIKMPLGTEVDLGPGYIVLDGAQLSPERSTVPPLFGPCLL